LNSGKAFFRYVQNLLSSRLVSKNVKIRMYKTIILSVILYGCEILSFTLREKHTLMMFENRVPSRIFGPKKDEVTGGLRKFLYRCTIGGLSRSAQPHGISIYVLFLVQRMFSFLKELVVFLVIIKYRILLCQALWRRFISQTTLSDPRSPYECIFHPLKCTVLYATSSRKDWR
jgi:hypothetical protein